MSWFDHRTLVIATQHKKEKAIAPLMEQAFSLRCTIPENLNTDVFGTFSGEVERIHDPLETARLKGREAARLTGADLVLSSEGSFGPHPQLFFIPFNQELILLQDFKNNFEIWITESSTETNYASAEIERVEALHNFMRSTGFPQHAIILKDRAINFNACYKGLNNETELFRAFEKLISDFGRVYAETDMRAMHNPKRMSVIEQATEKLITRMLNVCTGCGLPGFGIVHYEGGLPCSACQIPTALPLKKILKCHHCAYEVIESFPSGNWADPGHCEVCNP